MGPLDAPVRRRFVGSGVDAFWSGGISPTQGARDKHSESLHISGSENVEDSDFETILAEISAAFVRATADRISSQIDHWLQRIVLALKIDRASVAQLNPADGLLYATHQWAREGVVPIPESLNAIEAVPWLTNKLLADEPVVLSRVEDAPPEAAKDLEFAKIIGTKSTVAVPLKMGGTVVGIVVFDAVTRAQTWSPHTIQRLRLIADVFGNALERERADAEITRLREEMRRDLANRDYGRAYGRARP